MFSEISQYIHRKTLVAFHDFPSFYLRERERERERNNAISHSPSISLCFDDKVTNVRVHVNLEWIF